MAKDQSQPAPLNGADTAAATGAQGQMPLFYSNPVPLDAQKHKNLALKKDIGLDFAKSINAVPVNLVEFPQVCHAYPIAFAPDATATPVAVLGVRDNENLFIDKYGDWAEGLYIPAYIRRYPFIFSQVPNSEQLSLCIDNKPENVEENGEQRFFDEEGKAAPLAMNALEFCKSYHAAAQATVRFGEELAKSGILVERQAELNLAGGKKVNFAGFRVIDEQKLQELPDETFLAWRKNGWLPFIYAHLFAAAQWQRLTKALNTRMEKES